MKDNVILEKSENFALRIIKFCRYLKKEKDEIEIARQLVRSGTSIGANVAESAYASSKPDFINKLHIALKEASETEYWLRLLKKSETITEKEFTSLEADVKEILRMLIASINTSKNKSKKASKKP
ncbi:MAG: four helix bundle protein [Firmicutes bacterium]|nr:four helix bundle protein [Bacillota bacterium]